MAVKELPKNCFRAADLAREISIDPRYARARLRKAQSLPPCVKGPHVHNESWVFEDKHRAQVLKTIKPQQPEKTKTGKITAESKKAAEDLAS
jgi:hypothetical protein